VKFWRSTAGFLRRLFRRPPLAPGRFSLGQRSSLHGFISVSPAPPWRDYLLYLPRGHDPSRRAPLVVWMHGCQQDPEAFAAGSRIAAFADDGGFLVLLPRQSRLANSQRCWNWFDPRTAGGAGEAAIVAAQVAAVMQKVQVDRRRIYVAGLSSGGSLAATLALRAPQLFAGVAVHSGTPCGAASNTTTASKVMADGPNGATDAIAERARRDAPEGARVPALVIQGSADRTVAPVNAVYLARQFLLLNGLALKDLPPAPALPSPQRSASIYRDGKYDVGEYYAQGRLAVRVVTIDGLDHAWSGGEAGMAYFADGGPDATRLVCEFFNLI
jgi:poly(hydroxyalkanoate) depolymerase family esterase